MSGQRTQDLEAPGPVTRLMRMPGGVVRQPSSSISLSRAATGLSVCVMMMMMLCVCVHPHTYAQVWRHRQPQALLGLRRKALLQQVVSSERVAFAQGRVQACSRLEENGGELGLKQESFQTAQAS